MAMTPMRPDEFARILDTFGAQDFAPIVEKARQLLTMEGTKVSRGNHRAVPVNEIRDIERSRARNSYIRERQQHAEVARVAEQFLHERWYIHSVENGRIALTIFANEDGVGRAGIAYELPGGT